MSKAYNPLTNLEESDLLDFGSSQSQMGPSSGTVGSGSTNFGPAQTSIPQGPMNSSSRPSSGVEMQPMSGPQDSGVAEAVASVMPEFLRRAAHPYVCLFHLLFKALAILTYWFVYMFSKDIVLTFILTTTFLAVDFWTVKNVTGRILVGLRWWNKVKDDGTSEWIFESGAEGQLSALDKNIFWIALYAFPLYWCLAAISNLLSFSPNFVVLNIMGISFAGTNAVGYSKCSRSGQQQMSNWATNQAMKVFASNAVSNVARVAGSSNGPSNV